MFKKNDKAIHKHYGPVTIVEDQVDTKLTIGCRFKLNNQIINGCQLFINALKKIEGPYE